MSNVQKPDLVSVSIVIHNTPRQQLQKALSCLGALCVSHVYLLDNSSQNIDYSEICACDSRIEYKKIPNKGYGVGHNVALESIVRKNPDGYHIVMNPDVEWEGDIITPLMRYLEENNKVGLVSPKIYYPNGSLQYNCRMLPTPLDLILKLLIPQSLIKKRLDRYILREFDHQKPLNCPYLMGCFLMFRNKALIECGFFDKRFFLYPEDIDITRRIHKNWLTMYWPQVSIIHEHQQASKKNLHMLLVHIFNMIKYFNKWGWFKDKKRKLFNKNLMKEIVELKGGEIQKGRG